MNTKKSKLIGMLCLILCAALLCSAAYATGIDNSHKVSLSINFVKDGLGIPNSEFSIYRVADVSEYDLVFTTTDEFKSFPVDSVDNQDAWADLATTLAAYATASALEPAAKDKTDENGKVSFTNLATGLYLVVGTSSRVGDNIYTASPFMVCLPSLEEMDGNAYKWVYDVTADVKPGVVPVEKTNVEVVKVWNDKGNTKKRPAAIKVSLMLGDRVMDTVTLSKDNNWRYAWENIDAADWYVVENSVPNPYKVKITRTDNCFTVTNTYSSNTHNNNSPLPQTGTIWWIVPILACSGLALFSVGFIISRKHD